MGILLKAFFAALLALFLLLTAAEVFIPELGEMAERRNQPASSRNF